jgi:hypothetical protein
MGALSLQLISRLEIQKEVTEMAKLISATVFDKNAVEVKIEKDASDDRLFAGHHFLVETDNPQQLVININRAGNPVSYAIACYNNQHPDTPVSVSDLEAPKSEAE